MTIVLDIETVANKNAEKWFSMKKYSAPKNYKDEKKINQNILEQKAKDLEKAGLHWWTGQVICIVTFNLDTGEFKTFSNKDEKKLLIDFQNEFDQGFPEFIGKHSDFFDLPFLRGRILAHDLGLISALKNNQRTLRDVNHIFSYSTSCAQISTLEAYAFGLGILGKTMQANKVQAMYKDYLLGNHKAMQEIEAYCKQDVAITATLLKRYLKVFNKKEWE